LISFGAILPSKTLILSSPSVIKSIGNLQTKSFTLALLEALNFFQFIAKDFYSGGN